MFLFFFFNDPATTEIYTLSLHDALPIFRRVLIASGVRYDLALESPEYVKELAQHHTGGRSEEHTSELQSPMYLVCRLLLEKKKKNKFHKRHSSNELLKWNRHQDDGVFER